jgi:phenylalanine ammonia-lyase
LDRSEKVINRINGSVDMLATSLAENKRIYGVNTGFGGSADTRTRDLAALQRGAIQHQNAGILTTYDTGVFNSFAFGSCEFQNLSMPSSWARGLMVARINSIIRGHSAVSLPIIEAIISLLQKDFTPVIPVRGSISASGDLMPLSYLVGALQGNPDIFVRIKRNHGDYSVVSSNEALRLAEIEPVVLGAKEGLGLLNGMAASVSVASLAIYESNQLAVLAQVLTAMGCEALEGSVDSFHHFISDIRPHEGQIEAAANIHGFLHGSRLAVSGHGQEDMGGLAQDRYPLRTSSQWVGPSLEDLMLATKQIAVELNSTTDNPLIDVGEGLIHHGGNFQAASVTSAMEKTRLALQMFGKMLFAQATEIINPSQNRGLPPNLCADDPSLSFTFKGFDISMAAYCSELAFLCNPVSSHVQSAEMHNQAINSLALISARYTMQAVELLSMMSSAYLVLVCQALDLRVLRLEFSKACGPAITEITRCMQPFLVAEPENSEKSLQGLCSSVMKAWDETTTLDLNARCAMTAEVAATFLLKKIAQDPGLDDITAFRMFSDINKWKGELEALLNEKFEATRQKMFKDHTNITPTYLGRASARLYRFVRQELNIPLHRGLEEDPAFAGADNTSAPSVPKKTIGTLVSVVYESLRDGRLHTPSMDLLV